MRGIGFEKREYMKASVATDTLQSHKGEILSITGIAIFDKLQGGETVQVLSLKTADGKFISSNSPTAIDSANILMDIYEEDIVKTEGGLDIQIECGKSKSNREFIFISVPD